MKLPSLVLLTTSIACGTQPHLAKEAPENKCTAGAFPDEAIVVDIKRPERTRRALAWIPPKDGPYDVVVNLHEFRSEPNQQSAYSQWIPFAKEQGLMLVAPDGKSSTWNAGPCCGKAVEKQVDDVAFLDALIKHLDEVTCTSGRVYVTGIGNGAMMVDRWACQSDIPDAVVTVGGSLQLSECLTARPIPRLHYHGAADTFVPPAGGNGILKTGQRGGHLPTTNALNLWKTRNKAQGEPTTTTDGALTCQTFSGAAETTFCTIEGAGDTWPGANGATVDTTTPLGDATRGAWAWAVKAWETPKTPTPPPSNPSDDGAPEASETPQ